MIPDGESYYDRISLKNKTPEEAQRIMDLYNENINIAYKVASKYYKTNYWDKDEALQIAEMGLWKACLIWDPEKYKISTLAYNIINRDFIDHDSKQKRQPDILFNLQDTCVTDNLSLEDVLIDNSAEIEEQQIVDDSVKELVTDILYILDDVAEALSVPKSTVKLVYMVHIESSNNKDISMKLVNFIPRVIVKQIISELQKRLAEII